MCIALNTSSSYGAVSLPSQDDLITISTSTDATLQRLTSDRVPDEAGSARVEVGAAATLPNNLFCHPQKVNVSIITVFVVWQRDVPSGAYSRVENREIMFEVHGSGI